LIHPKPRDLEIGLGDPELGRAIVDQEVIGMVLLGRLGSGDAPNSA